MSKLPQSEPAGNIGGGSPAAATPDNRPAERMKTALGLTGLKIGARAVLAMIAYHAGTPRGAWASETTLADETGLTERSVRRSIQECEAAGYLTVLRRNGRVNLYQINLPAPVPVEDPDQRRFALTRTFDSDYRATPAEAAESAAARPLTPDTESGVPRTQSPPTPDSVSGEPERRGKRTGRGGGADAPAASAASPHPPVAIQAFRIWNETAARTGLRPALELTTDRATALAARVREAGGLDGWRKAVETAGRSAFLTGKKPGSYPATLDQVLKPEFFLKLREGNFNDSSPEAAPAAPDPAALKADVLASPLAGDAPDFAEALCERMGAGPVRSWLKDCRLDWRGEADAALLFAGGFTAERVEKDHGETIRAVWRELHGGALAFAVRRAA
ncbi:MAG: helix-turn-helix domain-containing protein [Rhodospirillaceae bacterium]|nr:helix-turn-helix domain-containing protein [Rhodospirillaceae bacterium]